MAHATPQVHNGLLTLHTASPPLSIDIESPAWWQWLDGDGTSTFRYLTGQGRFTARRESKSGGHYWYAYRRHQGKLRKAYLGKSNELTLARMDLIASSLAEQITLHIARDAIVVNDDVSSLRQRNVMLATGALAKESSPRSIYNLLLATKLYQPPVRHDLVPRPRLVELMRTTLQRKLTLITAPAGFGKTTLLSAWCDTLDATVPHAWLSLDASDNDLMRFWHYVTAALQTIVPSIADDLVPLLQELPPLPIESILTVLLNTLAISSHSMVLVLDDYHVIAMQSIHHSMAFLLEHLPAHVHIVIASRAEPELPLVRLRARDQLRELQASDLRFTGDEVVQFLNEVMGLALSREQIITLDMHTEGWVSGLQLAALSLQGRPDMGALIGAFNGRHRYIIDYLTSEVLQRQPPLVRDFLLHTAILDRLNASLCNAVTGREDGQAMLELIEQANLFLIPLDEERHWSRYHHLFSEFLLDRLRQEHGELIAELHRRASSWYEHSGLFAAAIHHAQVANDSDHALSIIEQVAQSMMLSGEVTVLLQWMAGIAEETTRSRPLFHLFYSGALTSIGQLDASEYHLHVARQALDNIKQVTRDLEGLYYACYAALSGFRGDVPQTITFAQKAFSFLPDNNAFVHSVVAASLGNAYIFSGDFVKAHEAFIDAINIGSRERHSHILLASMTGQGYLQAAQGQLRLSAETLKEALRLGEQEGHSPSVGMAYTLLGELSHEWNDLDIAERYVHEGLELNKRWGYAGALANGYTTLSLLQLARGNNDAALAFMDHAVQIIKTYNMQQFITMLVSMQAWLHCKVGNTDAAVRWVNTYTACTDDKFTFPQEFEHLFLVQILIAQERFAEASTIVEKLLPALETTGRQRSFIIGLVLQARLSQAQGHIEPAIAALGRALALAESEGYIRTFLDRGGEELIPLLRHAAARGLHPLYVHKLLTAFSRTERRETAHSAALLSEREMHVLQGIAAGKSNQALAVEFVVAISTIKTHLNNIYTKLSVHTRTQAIARGRELGLVP
jgi:ATP/maltotriose-dependent transcriptional regulator MalT